MDGDVRTKPRSGTVEPDAKGGWFARLTLTDGARTRVRIPNSEGMSREEAKAVALRLSTRATEMGATKLRGNPLARAELVRDLRDENARLRAEVWQLIDMLHAKDVVQFRSKAAEPKSGMDLAIDIGTKVKHTQTGAVGMVAAMGLSPLRFSVHWNDGRQDRFEFGGVP